jgi:hypothetical protein
MVSLFFCAKFAVKILSHQKFLKIVTLWAAYTGTAPYCVLESVLPIFVCNTVLFYLTVYTCLYILHTLLHPVYNVLLEKYTVKSPNAVWGLYVVIGNTNISLGPAQFICKAKRFFQKQSLHDIIFCFGYLYCRF